MALQHRFPTISYILFAIAIAAFSYFGTFSAISQEKRYNGFVGNQISEYDGIVNINATIRLLWKENKAGLLLCFHGEDEAPAVLATGELDNQLQGKLKGSVFDLRGNKIAEMELNKRLNEHRVIWEGTLSGNLTRQIRISNDDIWTPIKPSDPLIVTPEFAGEPPYIPQDLFVYAYPSFDRFQDALSALDAAFPYWRAAGNFCDVFDGHFTVDYSKTDLREIGSIIEKLKASGLFEYVELGIAEYGGMPEQITFSPESFPYKSTKEFSGVIGRLSNIIAKDFFCMKACDPAPISSKGWNVRSFEIEGRSEELFFKRARHWEKYTVSMTFYSNNFSNQDRDFNIQFYIVEGALAPSGSGKAPSASRYRENLVDSTELSAISSKIQQRIAKQLGGIYTEEF